MKIGFDFRMGGSINSGIGRYSFELLKQLLKNTTDEIIVFYHPDNTDLQTIDTIRELGGKLVPAKFRHYSFGEQFGFVKVLNNEKLDLVHFPNFNVPIFYKGKFVVTIHDLVHHKISGHKKSTYYKFLAYKYIIRHAAHQSEKILTVSEAAKTDIVEGLEVLPDKVVIIYEAPNRFEGTIRNFEEIKSTYLLSRPYLLFCGTLERKKNVIGLVKGFNAFLKKYKYDMDLVIAGKDDPHYPEIRQQCLEISCRDNLIFTGFVSDDIQASLYQNAFAFITASLHEGFGLPALEAMQYGIPVLSSNIPVFNEVYDNASLYFDPSNPDDIADKINLLVSDQPFYESMQKKSLERSSKFDWKETAKQTSEIYHSIFSSTSSLDLKPEIE